MLKIGEGEVLISEISRNSRKAHEIVELLKTHDVISVRRRGRLMLVSLNERGLELLNLLKRAQEVLKAPVYTQLDMLARTEGGGELPSFAVDNPWFSILAQRGRARVGV